MEILGLFSKTHVSFAFSGSPEQAAGRLSSLIAPNILKTWRREAVVGKSMPHRVVLYRYRPFVRNSFIPRFVGRFSVDSGCTVLTGAFSLHPIVRWFTVAWLSFVLAPLAGIVTDPVTGPRFTGRGTEALTLVAMALFGMGLVRFGRWCARTDSAYITGIIRSAAQQQAA
jgi:hypothetical protein